MKQFINYDTERFVSLLRPYNIVLNKSQTRGIRMNKKVAYDHLRVDYMSTFNCQITMKQLKKKVQNLKSSVKQKHDAQNEDSDIIMKSWEKELMHLWARSYEHTEQRDNNYFFSESLWESQVKMESASLPHDEVIVINDVEPLESKKHILNKYETEETIPLTSKELQRVVMLKQLQLTNMQIKREQVLASKQYW